MREIPFLNAAGGATGGCNDRRTFNTCAVTIFGFASPERDNRPTGSLKNRVPDGRNNHYGSGRVAACSDKASISRTLIGYSTRAFTPRAKRPLPWRKIVRSSLERCCPSEL